MTTETAITLDRLDRDIVALFATEPRIGVLEASRRLRVARGTVQARLDRMERTGVVTGWGPDISPAAIGYGVTAFVTIQIAQHSGREALTHRLEAIPEVLEVAGTSGGTDLFVQVVARDADDLYRIAGQVLAIPGVERTDTALVMRDLVDYRISPLLERRARE